MALRWRHCRSRVRYPLARFGDATIASSLANLWPNTRPTGRNDSKLTVFCGSRLIGYVYINFAEGQPNYVGTTIDHQSFGPYSRRMEAVEAVLEAITAGLTGQQRVMVALTNELVETMSVTAS